MSAGDNGVPPAAEPAVGRPAQPAPDGTPPSVPPARPVTEVAVGVLIRADGCFLLGQRPDGKPYAGYWEFPGGKVEAGETVDQALARELHEELGITAPVCEPWRMLEHDYPHAYVRLHVRKVRAWSGEPVGREGQALSWQRAPVQVEPLLPAAHPMVDWLNAEASAEPDGAGQR